jgi:maltose alpha-D-glucosyltransferase/alpha-amylase
VHAFVPQTIIAWQFTIDFLGRYLEHSMTEPAAERPASIPHGPLWELARGEASVAARHQLGGFLESAALLGRRLGELHVALAKVDEPQFAPEPFTLLYQRSLYQSAREILSQTFATLRRRLKSFSGECEQLATPLLAREKELLDRFRMILRQKLLTKRIRCHGDFHLGQVLFTGKDFLLIDFEGQPHRTLAARRIKRSGLQDLAGMIRSFYFAAARAMQRLPQLGISTPDAQTAWRQAAHFWYVWTSSAFLKAYGIAVAEMNLLPVNSAHLDTLLDFHLLERAVYELGSTLMNRAQDMEIPLRGLLDLALGYDAAPPNG